ncbi:MAG: DUF2304 domain-containing protein [Candidatus Omnitrophica bacterium]|nr:DUF2304 domain-containing protein [Candidatus Omnitrophota bacterium]
MLFRQKLFAILVVVFLLLLIVELIRRRKLREEYSFLWILCGISILVLISWYDLLLLLTKLIGAVVPTTTLFIFTLLSLFLIALHFCVKISELTDKIIKLTQELAILKTDIENKKA